MITRPKIWVRILFGVLALTLIAAGGFFLFRLGVARGAAMDGMPFSDGMPFADGYHDFGGMMNYRYPTMRFHYFPFGGLLFGFLFLMLIFGLLRRAFWGPRWAMYGGPRGRFGRMEEIHAEMHKRMDEAQGSASVEDAPTDEN